MEIIVAVDENFGIGKDNNLLARISPDLKRLRNFTVGNIIVMGSKTYMSFPKRPLPDRENLVITRSPENYPDVKCFTSVEEFLEYSKTADKPIFVLGGGQIYKQLLPYCDKAHITKILHSFEADTFFPNLDEDEEWMIAEEGEIIETEQYPFKYVTYVRK
ncbi:MAG: dihydrofolate reductase [Ruminiclostridium sp.]|nr:dihydrofolate reductase [Ruminiclostridium sp.]